MDLLYALKSDYHGREVWILIVQNEGHLRGQGFPCSFFAIMWYKIYLDI